jgi:hypothetical protein
MKIWVKTVLYVLIVLLFLVAAIATNGGDGCRSHINETPLIVK